MDILLFNCVNGQELLREFQADFGNVYTLVNDDAS